MTTQREPMALGQGIRLATGLSLVLAALLGVASIAGLLTGLGGMYEPYPPAEAGLFAQDLVVLFGALPLLLLGMSLGRRGSVAGVWLWSGMLFYAAYTYYFMVIGAFTVLFPVYIAIVATGTYALLALLAAFGRLKTGDREASERVPRRAVAIFFGVIVLLFVVLWGGLVASTLLAGEALNPVQHLVVAIDAAILLPLLAFAAVRLWRRDSGADLLGGMLVVKAGATGFTLAFTGWFAQWWSGQFVGEEMFLVAIFAAMAVGSAVLFAVAVAGREGRSHFQRTRQGTAQLRT